MTREDKERLSNKLDESQRSFPLEIIVENIVSKTAEVQFNLVNDAAIYIALNIRRAVLSWDITLQAGEL